MLVDQALAGRVLEALQEAGPVLKALVLASRQELDLQEEVLQLVDLELAHLELVNLA